MADKQRISVSKMAEIHGISRQTLIFYDKIGLFRPAVVAKNGYRYYTYTQIPFLREICFLKSVGVKLEDIKQHIDHRTTDTALDLLLLQQAQLEHQIADLTKMRRNVTDRIHAYCNAPPKVGRNYQPFLTEIPKRTVLFAPWGTDEMERNVLHVTLMKAWTLSEKYECSPSNWGAILRRDALGTDTPLAGAGAYVIFADVPVGEEDSPHVIHLEAGEYACLYHYNMPYELEAINQLLRWIEEEGYEIVGDVVDRCLIDTTIYTADQSVDFCQIQIPVRRRSDLN